MSKEEQRQDAIISLIISTVGVAIAAITTYVIPWIKELIETHKLNRFIQFAYEAVRAANQTLSPEQWAEKKVRVETYLIKKMEQIHINLTKDDLENIIEGIVNKVKEEKAKEEATKVTKNRTRKQNGE